MVTLMFNGGRMVMLWRLPFYWRENGLATRGGQLNVGRIIIIIIIDLLKRTIH